MRYGAAGNGIPEARTSAVRAERLPGRRRQIGRKPCGARHCKWPRGGAAGGQLLTERIITNYEAEGLI